jgi:hypothetical protein
MSDEVLIKKIVTALEDKLADLAIADHLDALNALTEIMIETLKTVEYLTEREAYKRAAEVFADAAAEAAAEEAAEAAAKAEATRLTGRAQEPLQRVEEFAAVVGRRGGKSRAMATLAVFIAGLCKHPLVRGERGVLLCIAPDQRQAAIVLDYATAAFEQSPILKQLIANRTSDTLELTSGVNIEVRAASFRRLRGPTYIAVIADEAAFWFSDEFSANADAEILNAVRPGLVTTNGPLIIASSPYVKRGVLWDTHRKHYGPDGDPLILVAQGASRDFNPSLPQSVVDRAMKRDPVAASAEFLGQFRSDIESFVS